MGVAAAPVRRDGGRRRRRPRRVDCCPGGSDERFCTRRWPGSGAAGPEVGQAADPGYSGVPSGA